MLYTNIVDHVHRATCSRAYVRNDDVRIIAAHTLLRRRIAPSRLRVSRPIDGAKSAAPNRPRLAYPNFYNTSWRVGTVAVTYSEG